MSDTMDPMNEDDDKGGADFSGEHDDEEEVPTELNPAQET